MSLRLVDGEEPESSETTENSGGMSEEDLNFFYKDYGFTMCKHCLIPVSTGAGQYCSPACEAADK